MSSVHRQPHVSLIHPMGRAGNVVQLRRRNHAVFAPSFRVHLRGMGDKPDMDLVVLGEAFHLAQGLADVFRFEHPLGTLVFDLVVGINDQAIDAVAYRGHVRPLEDPVDCRGFIVGPQEHEMILGPRHRFQ